MSIETRQIGIGHETGHTLLEQAMHKPEGRPAGSVVYTKELVEVQEGARPFLNPNFGTSMNQNIAFGSVASVVHDGGDSTATDAGTADTDTLNHVIQAGKSFTTTCVVGMFITGTNTGHITVINSDTDLTCDADICPNGNEAYTIDPVWVGAAVQGSWLFSDSGKVTLTSGANADTATFDANSAAAYDPVNFTAFTGKIDLDNYNPANNSILLQFDLNGTNVGNQIDLNDFISTGNFAQQNFVVTTDELGLDSGQLFNGLTVTFTRFGGPQGAFKLDQLQFEASGTPAVFKVQAVPGTILYISDFLISFSDNVASTVTDGTMPGIDHNAFFGVSSLTNGLLVQVSIKGRVVFSFLAKNFGNFLSSGATFITTISNGTNSYATLVVPFKNPVIFTGDDFVSITINDDLSGLTEFTALARAATES